MLYSINQLKLAFINHFSATKVVCWESEKDEAIRIVLNGKNYRVDRNGTVEDWQVGRGTFHKNIETYRIETLLKHTIGRYYPNSEEVADIPPLDEMDKVGFNFKNWLENA